MIFNAMRKDREEGGELSPEALQCLEFRGQGDKERPAKDSEKEQLVSYWKE